MPFNGILIFNFDFFRIATTMPLVEITENQLHLWIVRPHAISDRTLLARYSALLAPAERTRHLAFRFERHQHEFLITRALVRSVLAQYHAIEPADWQFKLNEYGRPEITPPIGLYFNLSNTDGLIVCALARCQEVGVDVEARDRAERILELESSVFSSAERAQLSALPSPARPNHALSLWTLKESYIKAKGKGLSIPLKQFSYLYGEDNRIGIQFDPVLGDSEQNWKFLMLDYHEHRISLSINTPAPVQLQVREIVPLVSSRDLPPSLAQAKFLAKSISPN